MTHRATPVSYRFFGLRPLLFARLISPGTYQRSSGQLKCSVRLLSLRDWISALVTIVLLGATPGWAADSKPLIVAEKSRAVAKKDTYFILVLDLNPSIEELKKDGAEAPAVMAATATAYAREYLAKAEFAELPKVVVYLIAVDSMDEYNRANFSGMKRFGTITFERKNGDVARTENKISFNP
ncbi:hypothetical protein ACE10Z_32625 [Bradyrhizobium sp. Pha-3]|uniref:hypothetical protein n=1 Tax=Bradyrhizobium sp. Pha-3 TaxID=208375 RepID=UPI0035D3E5A7